MKKEVIICDFCKEDNLKLADKQCVFCKKYLCKDYSCSGKPKLDGFNFQSEYFPFICRECSDIMKYKTVIDRTWSDSITKELQKLILSNTEKERKILSDAFKNVFSKLYNAGIKNKKKDDLEREKAKKVDRIDYDKKIDYIPF
jgi:hypothetical protein